MAAIMAERAGCGISFPGWPGPGHTDPVFRESLFELHGPLLKAIKLSARIAALEAEAKKKNRNIGSVVSVIEPRSWILAHIDFTLQKFEILHVVYFPTVERMIFRQHRK